MSEAVGEVKYPIFEPTGGFISLIRDVLPDDSGWRCPRAIDLFMVAKIKAMRKLFRWLKLGGYATHEALYFTSGEIITMYAAVEQIMRPGQPRWRYAGASFLLDYYAPGWRKHLPKGFALDREDAKVVEWRRAVLKRDGYTCQKCGSTENPEAHHELQWILYPFLRVDVNNGITLCERCHKDEPRERAN